LADSGFEVEVCAVWERLTVRRLDGSCAALACIEVLAGGWFLEAGAVSESDVPSQ